MAKNEKRKLKTTTYSVENSRMYRFGEESSEVVATYDLDLSKVYEENYHFEIDRKNFLINGKKIKTKFLETSYTYFQCLFPMQFQLIDNQFILYNSEEIQQQIVDTEKRLKESFFGSGLEYITEQFFSKTQTKENLINFIHEQQFMQVLQLNLTSRNDEDKNICWNIGAIGNSDWNGAIQRKIDQLSFEPKNKNAQQLLHQIMQYAKEYSKNTLFTKDQVGMIPHFLHKANYLPTGSQFLSSETDVRISVEELFDYQERIILNSKN